MPYGPYDPNRTNRAARVVRTAGPGAVQTRGAATPYRPARPEPQTGAPRPTG